MASCRSCSAPLPANGPVCSYCGTRNDVDLQGLGRTEAPAAGPARCCPDCGIPLTAHILPVGEGVEARLDRCGKCLGLFFDTGELDAVLASVTEAFSIDFEALPGIALPAEGKIRYRKCPVCAKMMNRLNYATRSGVVTDQCAGHGTWLEAGELRRLAAWRRAGGHLFHEQAMQAKAVRERKEAEEKKRRLEKLKREADQRDRPDHLHF